MAEKIKLLVFEDSELFREAFLELSKKYSFEILGFSQSSKDLLRQIEEKNPQAVILDLVVPEEDTFELIQNIKNRDPKLSIIACSSLKEDHIVSKALKAGCFDYIFKPFEEEDLAQSIKNAVA